MPKKDKPKEDVVKSKSGQKTVFNKDGKEVKQDADRS